MAQSQTHRILSAHRDIFEELDDTFDHVDGAFGPLNTFLAVMALTAARRTVNYRDVLKEMHQEWSWLNWEETPSEGALSKARANLTPDECRDVWQAAVEKASAIIPNAAAPLSERRVFAFDGTRVVTPSTAGARKRWGQPSEKNDKKAHNPQPIMVAAWNVATGIPLDIALLHYRGSERLGASRILDALVAGDIALFDRGFPGFEFFASFIAHGVDLIARMNTEATAWLVVRDFLASDQDDCIVRIDLHDGHGERSMRLIRRHALRGAPKKGQKREKMVILTTLLDHKKYPAKTILALYDKRWNIETRFRELKLHYGLESFHSNRVDCIEQEIYAVLTWMTLASMVEYLTSIEVARRHGHQDWMDPQRWVVRRTDIFSATRRLFFAVWVKPAKSLAHLKELAEGEAEWIATGARRKRPGRSYPRVTKRPWGRWK